MSALILDTHVAVWSMVDRDRLSAPAREAIRIANDERAAVYVPTICLVELTYLIEKGRLAPEIAGELIADLLNPKTNLTEVPLDTAIARRMGTIDRRQVPDMPDRIIAATAAAFALPLVTRDNRIRASNVTTIW